jgi:LacI family transcriptional regulator, galactose operon repressor
MPNLSDVAKRAKVSVSTVSAVLRGKHVAARITELCALRVRQAAEELGYTPNYHAQSMRLGRAHVIGFAMQLSGLSETGSLYFSSLFGGVHTAIQDAGYHLMLIRDAGEIGALERAVTGVRQQMLDGLVIPGQASTLRIGDKLSGPQVQDLPAVVVDPDLPTSLPSVTMDGQEGIRMAVQHLGDLGHRHLLWLGPKEWSANPTVGREQAFITATWDAGLQGSSWRYPDMRSSDSLANACHSAEKALSEKLTQDRDFTAIVCYNDFVAIGALRALQNAGLRVPQDVSVVGFDDSPLAQVATPPLTSVSHRLAEMGLQAGRLVLEMVTGGEEARKKLQNHQQVVRPLLQVRQSTATPPPAQ